MNKQDIEIVTVWRGKDVATYIASELRELGNKAKPIRIRQDPSKNEPWHEIELQDVDTIEFSKPGNQEQGNDMAKWDVKALQRLLEPSGETKGADGE